MKRLSALTRALAVFGVFQAMRSYLDPGSGSLIVQILVAIIVGALATFRFWKTKLLSLFGVQTKTDDDDDKGDTENRDIDPI